MRLNLRNEKSRKTFSFRILGRVFLLCSMAAAIQPKRPARNLLQFSSPLMNTFSNYMQRENISSLDNKPALKKEVSQMTSTIDEAKKMGVKNFLKKHSKKKSIRRRKKKKAHPFLDDIKKYIGTPVVGLSEQTEKQVGSPKISVNAPVASSENQVSLLEDGDAQTRELKSGEDDRELKTPDNVSEEVSVASDPSQLDNLEQIKMQEAELERKKEELDSEESRIHHEEADLETKKDTIAKAEQEMKLEEGRFEQQRAQEYQKIHGFEEDIAAKEQFLSTENQQLEGKEAEVHKKVDDLSQKIHEVEAKQKDFEQKLHDIQHQRSQLEHEKQEMSNERHQIEDSKRISKTELATAKKEQANIDHQNEDLQHRVQEVKTMRNQLGDLKDAYSVAFHKVVVHENNLKGREKMLQVAEAEIARQKADMAQKLIQFKNEYALRISREQAVDLRMGDIVHKEDVLNTGNVKRKLKVDAKTDASESDSKQSLQETPADPTQTNVPALNVDPSFMSQMQQAPSTMGSQMRLPRGMNFGGAPPMNAYRNMPMPNFGDFRQPGNKPFGADSLGNNGMMFQPSKDLVKMMDKPKFLDDPYMKTKDFFKDEKLLI